MAKLLDFTKLFGGTLFLMGSALSLTLWLLPLGLPMALVGLAMLSAPQNNERLAVTQRLCHNTHLLSRPFSITRTRPIIFLEASADQE